MSTSNAFTATGVGAEITLPAGKSITYALSGTFVGTLGIQKSTNNFQTVDDAITPLTTTATTTTLLNDTTKDMQLRWYCSAYTSGTATGILTDVNNLQRTVKNDAGVVLENINTSSIDFLVNLTETGNLVQTGNQTVTGNEALTGNEAITGNETVSGTINKVTITQPATGSTLTIIDGKTLTVNNSLTLAGVDGKTLTANNSLTLAGTDGTTQTFPATSDVIMQGRGARQTAQVDVTSSTALVALTGLAVALVAGGTYTIEGYIPGTAGASGGVKVSLDTSDTLTATSLNFTASLQSAAALAVVSATALATGVGTTAAVIHTYIDGTIVVNAAGTLVVKFAQNASNGTASSAYVNGFLKVTRIA